MADCTRYKRNLDICNCSYPGCSRKGNCCACLEYHRSRGEMVACYFPDDVEKTWDRSLRRFKETIS
ncbi:MAG: hypothetical protein P9M03_04375 [Candidatus Theseobacter exili]|nr:hypothetical protein [Candidatus Theseobacter exili]